MNESINDEAVYRTAPATPGLLNSVDMYCSVLPASCSARSPHRWTNVDSADSGKEKENEL